MIRIGFIGLDTSHPASFIKLLNNMNGVQVTAVHDNGAVRDEKYIEKFCAEHSCQHFQSLEEMAQNVDAVMILGVNWDWHLEQAKPFLKGGKAVYVDKPLCGNMAELSQFEALVTETKAPFLAGSGWRFNTKVLSAAQQCAHEDVTDIYVESCLPAYFYGIHAIELAIGLLGSEFTKVHTVNWDIEKAGVLLTLEHSSGKHALIKMAPSQHYWRGALFHHNNVYHQVTFEVEDIHGSVCETFVETIRQGTSIYNFASCSESVRIMLAAQHSMQTGETVNLKSTLPKNLCFDGAAFLEAYRK